jgi:uncharacterized protein (DUF58 family)
VAEAQTTSRAVVAAPTTQHSPLGGRLRWSYLVGSILLIGGLLRNQPLLIMGLLLGLAVFIAWLWAKYALAELTYTRELSEHRVFYMEPLTLTCSITNNKPLPVPRLQLDDTVPNELRLDNVEIEGIKGLDATLPLLYSLGWYERVSRKFEARGLPRGVYNFGPVALTSGDIFSFFTRSTIREQADELIVYPRIVPVDALKLPADMLFGDFKAAVRPLLTDPLRLLGTRPYQYGDSVRYINWKATARARALQTKVFEPVANLQLYIVLNQETYSHVWEGIDTSALELAITVAASLAQYAIESGYQTGLEVNAVTRDMREAIREGSGYLFEHMRLPASRDPEQLTRILEALARIDGWGGMRQRELIERVRYSLPLGATMLLVTAVVDDDVLDEVAALMQRGHPVYIVRVGNVGLAVREIGGVPIHDIAGEDYRELESLAFA